MSKLLHLAPTEGEEATLKFRRQLWEDRDFTDVILEVVGGEEIHCHSVILAAASPVLRQKLLKARQNQTCLDLDKEDSCSALVLKKLMEFIYLGECRLPETEIKQLLETGERLQVDGLCLPREGGREEEAQVEKMEGSTNLMTAEVIKKMDNVVALLECERHHKNQSLIEEKEKFQKKLHKQKTAGSQETRGGTIQESKDNCDKSSIEQRSQFFEKFMKQPSANNPNFKCNVCGHESSQKSSLKNHIEAKHALGTFEYNCIICSNTFGNRSRLYEHNRKTHGKKRSMK